MDILFGILAAAVAIAVVLFVLGRKAVTRGVDPTQLTFDPSVMADVRALTLAGNKIQAIALLRESAPGLSLVTAKMMVERMAQSAQQPKPAAPNPVADAATQAFPVVDPDAVPSSSAVPFEVELEARNLKAQGQQIAAIALVRENAGFGLADAKGYVDSL